MRVALEADGIGPGRATMRRDFGDDSRPEFQTDGQLGGVGLRYDYTDEFTYDNPTSATKVRLFGDVYDGRLGSSFDYVDWGARASVVRPLVTPKSWRAELEALAGAVGDLQT